MKAEEGSIGSSDQKPARAIRAKRLVQHDPAWETSVERIRAKAKLRTSGGTNLHIEAAQD
jgi:hypothetical protein